jgi:heme/copper-type cytochrome/quinol oxidase subunit 4
LGLLEILSSAQESQVFGGMAFIFREIAVSPALAIASLVISLAMFLVLEKTEGGGEHICTLFVFLLFIQVSVLG